MIVEEKKAGEKECRQISWPEGYPGFCSGSRCMAWRWADVKNPDYVPANPMQCPPPLPWENPLTVKSTSHGYCGLSGRP